MRYQWWTVNDLVKGCLPIGVEVSQGELSMPGEGVLLSDGAGSEVIAKAVEVVESTLWLGIPEI